MNGIERRRHPRFPCNISVEIEWGSEILRASVRDISLTGMFVVTDSPLWMRAEFTARLVNGDSFPVSCVVKRIEPTRGMGVAFTEVPETSRKPLEDLLWKMAGG